MTTPNSNARVAAAWWEKTVEYAFVRDFMPLAHEAFPLDGNAEKAFGDLITKGSEGFRLIEFKATSRDIASEKEKYPSFQNPPPDVKDNFHSLLAACEPRIVKHEGRVAHWLIYGQPIAGARGFGLEARAYTGVGGPVVPLARLADLQQLITVSHDKLLKYLAELERARGSSVGKGTATGTRLMIVGVKGGRMLALTVEEFRSLYPTVEPKHAMKLGGSNVSSTTRTRRPHP